MGEPRASGWGRGAAVVLADEALANAKGCLDCHAVDKKAVGPTYRDVAQKCAGQTEAVTRIRNAIIKGTPIPGGVGWQKEDKAALPFMPPNSSLRPDESYSWRSGF